MLLYSWLLKKYLPQTAHLVSAVNTRFPPKTIKAAPPPPPPPPPPLLPSVPSVQPVPPKLSMGNDSVTIQFNPDNRVFWTEHIGLTAFNDEELEGAYQRSYKFIKDRVKILINDHKWKDIDFGSRQLLLSLARQGHINRFTLPHEFSSFLSTSNFTDYKAQFEQGVFEARRPSPSSNDLYIAGSPALADIFYILQCVAPGMLVLTCRTGETDDMGELEWIRGLPREQWVEQNAQMLRYILGSKMAYNNLLAACRDKQKSFAVSWAVSWGDDDDSDCRSTGSTVVDEDWMGDGKLNWSNIEVFDGRPCGSECGGCVRCGL